MSATILQANKTKERRLKAQVRQKMHVLFKSQLAVTEIAALTRGNRVLGG
jgi:hypothetical protein